MSWLYLARHRRLLLSGAGVLASVAALAGSTLVGPAAAADNQPIAQMRAAALIQATSGDSASQVQAIGDKAKLINAALPFSDAPVVAAHAFVLPAGETLDQRRALLCLTQAVYYEAGYEPMQGRRAVAQVVLNRMRHPAFPKSVCGVVYQRNATPVCQFSFVCDGSLNRAPAAGAWAESRRIAAAALAGFVEPSVGSATHYHADYVAPYWAPKLAKLTQVGVHIFYRWPGAWGSTAAFTGRYIGEPADPLSLRPPLRRAVLTDGTILPVEEPALAGPPIRRADNDVGGLLDTSKGWTLNIPMPSESGTASKSVVTQQPVPAGSADPVTLASRE